MWLRRDVMSMQLEMEMGQWVIRHGMGQMGHHFWMGHWHSLPSTYDDEITAVRSSVQF